MLANNRLPLRTPEVSVLFREFAHRVVNEYTDVALMLSVAASELRDQHGRDVLLAAVSRVQAFSAAHSALCAPESSGEIDIARYLERALEKNLKSRGLIQHLVTTISIDAIEMDSVRAWYLALITTELVNNALRHGNTAEGDPVHIQLRRKGDFATLTVTNCSGNEAWKEMGTGCSVVRGLAEAVDGHVSWRFAPASTTANLTFPVHSKRWRKATRPRRNDVPADFHF